MKSKIDTQQEIDEAVFVAESKKLKSKHKKLEKKIELLKGERRIYYAFSDLFQNEIGKLNKEIDLLTVECNEISRQLDELVKQFESLISLTKFDTHTVIF